MWRFIRHTLNFLPPGIYWSLSSISDLHQFKSLSRLSSDATSSKKSTHQVSLAKGPLSPLTARAIFSFCFFLGLHPHHMEATRLGVELELQLPAYTTATARPDLSCFCALHHSSWQRQILNPLSEARDWTCNLMVPSQICFCGAAMGTPDCALLKSTEHVVHYQEWYLNVTRKLEVTNIHRIGYACIFLSKAHYR